MVILIALAFFLSLSAYVIHAVHSSNSAHKTVEEVYIKLQAYHVLKSVFPYILLSLRNEDRNIDTLNDTWAFPFVVSTERGELEVIIYDEDRFINLNYIGQSEAHRRVFERLLELLRISPFYTERILAWTGRSLGTFESEYPIKRANFDSKEELKYLGFTYEELYGRKEGDVEYPGLMELVTVYSSGKININTAPKYIIMALDKDIDSVLADKIIEYRSSKPFKRIDDIVLVEGVTFDILYRIRNIIDVKSQYFRIKATLRIGDVETTLDAVYDRKNNRVVYKKIY